MYSSTVIMLNILQGDLGIMVNLVGRLCDLNLLNRQFVLTESVNIYVIFCTRNTPISMYAYVNYI